MPTSLDRARLVHLARIGAQARLAELRTEIASLRAAFPELPGLGEVEKWGRQRAARAVAAESTGSAHEPRKVGRRGWTAAQRKEAAERMKAYWAKKKTGRSK